MARKPVYGNHKGSARTTVNGKRVYLGEYNSPKSIAAFDRTPKWNIVATGCQQARPRTSGTPCRT